MDYFTYYNFLQLLLEKRKDKFKKIDIDDDVIRLLFDSIWSFKNSKFIEACSVYLNYM